MPAATRKSPEPAPTGRQPAPIVGSSTARVAGPKLSPRAQWVYAHPPGAYDVFDGRILPQMRELPLSAGLNGIKTRKDGSINARAYLGRKADEGWTVLEDPATTQDRQPYLRHVVTNDGLDHWHTRWERPVPAAEYTETDPAGYQAWLQWLMDSGIVARPRLHDLERLAQRVRGHLIETERAAASVPAKLVDVELLRQRLAVIDAEVVKLRGGA